MYSKLLQSYPLLTKCTTTGLIFSLADFISQKYIEEKQHFDRKRSLTFFLTGSLYFGSTLHWWYSRLLPQIVNRVVGSHEGRLKSAVVGMLFDQIIFAPAFLCGFFVSVSFFKDFTISGARNGIKLMKNKIKQALITNWQIWPVATLVNMMIVPIQFRAIFANFVGLFWNTYLSFISNN